VPDLLVLLDPKEELDDVLPDLVSRVYENLLRVVAHD
jgi:hypothetical protein